MGKGTNLFLKKKNMKYRSSSMNENYRYSLEEPEETRCASCGIPMWKKDYELCYQCFMARSAKNRIKKISNKPVPFDLPLKPVPDDFLDEF